jgi:hypothetical protein
VKLDLVSGVFDQLLQRRDQLRLAGIGVTHPLQNDARSHQRVLAEFIRPQQRAQSGLHRTPLARAVATGLQTRPLAHTLMDTATWAAMQMAAKAPEGGPARPAVGLAADREAALLAGWAARG